MTATERTKMLVSLVRPPVAVLLGLFAVAAMTEAGGSPEARDLARVFVTIVGFLVAAVVVNDLSDTEIDRVNLEGAGRPLVDGRAHRSDMRTVATTAAITSVIGAAAIGSVAVLAIIGGLLLAVAYSIPPIRLADRGAVASMLLPAGYVAVPYVVGLAAVDAPPTMARAALLGGLYLGFIGRILLKDFRDLRGDALFGKRTFLVRHGRRTTCAVSAWLWAAGSLTVLVVRDPTLGLVTAHAALTAAALVLLGALARSSSPRRDEALVAAVAIVGRGAIVGLIAHWSAVDAGWMPWTASLLSLTVAALTIGQAHTMARFGPRTRLWLPHTWSTDSGAAFDPGHDAQQFVGEVGREQSGVARRVVRR